MKTDKNESWRTLGPYNYDLAHEVMWQDLKKGNCCWIEDVEIGK